MRALAPTGGVRQYAGMPKPSDAVRMSFASINALLATAVLFGVFGALPVRYWMVDVSSALMAALLLISAYGLWRRSRWDLRALRVSAACELALGLSAVAALVLGVVYLGGVHGTVGRTASIVAVLGTALLLPYFIIYPSLQLLWIHRATESARHA